MMARAKSSFTKEQSIKSVILILFCSALTFSSLSCSSETQPEKPESMRAKARVYVAFGNYKKAQHWSEKALNRATATDAPDSEMCSCLLDLAYVYNKQGKLAEAETMCLSSRDLLEKVYGSQHVNVVYMLRILSEIYQNQARYREAAESLESALTIMRVSVEDANAIATFEVDMAHLLVAQGDFAQAESYFTEAIAVIEKNYGLEHPYTVKVYIKMAALHELQGRYTQAEELVSKALPIQEKYHGSDNHLLIPLWLVKSRVHQAKGDMVNAKILLEKSLRVVENQIDSGHLVKADVLNRLGEFYILAEEYAKAEDALQRALKVMESSRYPNSDRTAIALNGIAKVYVNQGEYDKAQNLCSRAIDILESVFDEHHPKVADVLETLVTLHRKTGNMAEATNLEQRVKEIRTHK